MGDDFVQRLKNAVAHAKQVHAGGTDMGLAIHLAAEKYQLNTSQLAREMGNRSAKKRISQQEKRKPYVRLPPPHWMDSRDD